MPLREDILLQMKYSQKGMWKGNIMPLREDILPQTKCSQRAKRHIKIEDIKELLMPHGRICPYWEENSAHMEDWPHGEDFSPIGRRILLRLGT